MEYNKPQYVPGGQCKSTSKFAANINNVEGKWIGKEKCMD